MNANYLYQYSPTNPPWDYSFYRRTSGGLTPMDGQVQIFTDVRMCPVCSGRGEVPPNFYTQNGFIGTNCDNIKCRACDGEGYIKL